MQENQKGIIKIISGVILAIAGTAGLIFGRGIKQRVLRIAVLILSVCSIGSGYYLIIDGMDDIAVGTVGQYKLGAGTFQGYAYPSKQDLINGLNKTFAISPDVRRLHYQCPDKSAEATIHNTKLGLIGVPDKSILCSNGEILIGFAE